MTTVRIERDDRVALVRFSRGDGRNASSAALMAELTETARALARDTTTSAVILTGDGAFSAGADLKDPAMAARAAARAWAEKIAALPPIPVRMAKAGINGAATALHRATSFMDLDQFTLAATTEDHKEAVRAFLEKAGRRVQGRLIRRKMRDGGTG